MAFLYLASWQASYVDTRRPKAAHPNQPRLNLRMVGGWRWKPLEVK